MDQEEKLKRYLFDIYGGFADKRIKNLSKSNTFIVDDRRESDFSASGRFYSSFCAIFVRVVGSNSVDVDLLGNVPINDTIRGWVEADGSTYEHSLDSCLKMRLLLGDEDRLDALAALIEAIVRPSAPRYSVPSYKYTCPRTAASLRRLAVILRNFDK